ncbi:pentapeptide repeat-containing protein [Micromonospora chersina]|uniref:pentapeptide repeat-containing protein n=1 Tax=Micromonospora chersina TaxID=47854 RepID=UPI0037207A5B
MKQWWLGRYRDAVRKLARRWRRRSSLQIPLYVHIAFWLIVGLLVATGVLCILWQSYGRPKLASLPAGGVEPRTLFDAAKVALTVVAGLGGVVALVVAYRRQGLNEAEHKREDAKLFTERFVKASELLGSEKAAIRLAGVYAMASLADDWPHGRQTCIDVLCAYIRMPQRLTEKHARYGRPAGAGSKPERLETDTDSDVATDYIGEARYNPREERQVRETVTRVIVDHLHEDAPTNWFGHVFDFTGATFEDLDFGGADFTNCQLVFDDCIFYGETNFSGSYFYKCKLSFLSAIYAGRMSFEVAHFEDCDINLHGDLTGEGEITFYASKIVSGEIDLTTPRGVGGLSFIGTEIEGGTISLFNLDFAQDGTSASFGMSRSMLKGGTFRFLGGNFAGGTMYFNGLTVAGGDLIIGSDPTYGPTPEHARKRFRTNLSGAKFSFWGARIEAGAIRFIDAELDGSEVNFEAIEMSGGEISFPGSSFRSGSLVFSADSEITGGVVSFGEAEQHGANLQLEGLRPEMGVRVVPFDQP